MHLLLRYPAMQVSFDWARGQCLLLFGWACVANACFFWIKPGCLAGSSKNLVCLYAYEDTSSVLKTCLPLYRCTAGQRMLFIIWAYEPGYVAAIKPCTPLCLSFSVLKTCLPLLSLHSWPAHAFYRMSTWARVRNGHKTLHAFMPILLCVEDVPATLSLHSWPTHAFYHMSIWARVRSGHITLHAYMPILLCVENVPATLSLHSWPTHAFYHMSIWARVRSGHKTLHAMHEDLSYSVL